MQFQPRSTAVDLATARRHPSSNRAVLGGSPCSPRCSTYACPLDGRQGDDVFLMNTFTDAQLIVSRDVADVLDRVGHEQAQFSPEERDARHALRRTASSSRAARRTGRRSSSSSATSAKIRGQLRVTVLTTLQCNFACDYCIQGDHGDYNKHAAKMSLETADRAAEWAEQRLDASALESFVLTFFGGEPLLNLPVLFYLVRAALGELPAARRADGRSTSITNGLLLTPEVVDRLVPLGLNGDQGHARRRSRHAQPDAAAARRPGHVRQDHRQRPPGRRASAASRSAATSTRARSTAIPALLDFLREQEFADKLVEGGVQADHQAAAGREQAERADPADGRRHRRQAAERRLHDVGGRGRPASATTATSSTRRCRSCGRKPRSADSRPWTACTWARARFTGTTPTPSARTARCTPARGLRATRSNRPATSTAGRRRGASRRRDASSVIAAWKECDDCAFIPVCAGGCSVAAHTELWT